MPLKYTREPPAVEGAYWMRRKGRKSRLDEQVKMLWMNHDFPHHGLYYTVSSRTVYVQDLKDYLFAGPIERPEEVSE